ncbi:hypothetical protein BJ508DRAFT_381957 [Ascobolus immersus RN42]|uniref:Fungal N-terminal domain-containing protein n=1 Tax=Ascobolus immersus RN42 TaxID=1160509 RepID=A0A3N4HEL6_ASCIM|nr:hypothetical protein BJ508DRAFT_381957 [Ascobolus immersus RN42]
MSGVEILGVVAASCQFGAYAFKFLKAARDSYSCTTELTEELEEISSIVRTAERVFGDTDKLFGDQTFANGDHEMKKLYREGSALANELRAKLDIVTEGLTHDAYDKTNTLAKRAKALKTAFSAAATVQEISEMEPRLQKLMAALSARSLSVLR